MKRSHSRAMPSRLLSLSLLLTLTRAQTYGNLSMISNVSTSACPTQQGAHIIVARASYEPPGYGIIGYVKDQILAQVPGSTAEAVDYPAVISPNYIESESDGVVAMRQLIRNFVGNCSDSPLVVMGYSQGAHAAADSLAGQDDAGFPDNTTIDTPLSDSTLARTAAVILMGDPTFTLNETFHVGNAARNGLFPRRNGANFQTSGLVDRMKSYCNMGDPYCAAGSNLTVHLLYVQEYGAQATQFVVEQVKSWYANSSNATPSASGAGSPSSTTSPAASQTGAAVRAGFIGFVPTVVLAALVVLLL